MRGCRLVRVRFALLGRWFQRLQLQLLRLEDPPDELQGTVREIGQKVLRQNVINTDPTTNTDARVMEVRIELNPDSSQKANQFTNAQVTAKITIE